MKNDKSNENVENTPKVLIKKENVENFTPKVLKRKEKVVKQKNKDQDDVDEQENKVEENKMEENKVEENKAEEQGLPQPSENILEKINVAEVEELDKSRFSDLSNQDLFKILYVRGLKQENPTVYHTARKALLELSLTVNTQRRTNFNRRGSINQRGFYSSNRGGRSRPPRKLNN